ncbi:MAG: HD domain-containing protein [Oscillospiraceae bacterium]|nr:HD domain-containing protein [Oscillospiraceae bacterium]
MKINEFIRIINIFEAMKRNTRHSWLSDGRHESVAEHSWRVTIMAYFLKDEFPGVDIDKVIKMCLFHDIGEAFTGDIPAFLKTDEDEIIEENTIEKFIETLPTEYRDELALLFEEMNRLETPEARIYKTLDKMETLIQHNEADISTWLPLEYEMNLVYGEKEVQFSEYMKALKKAVNEETVRKIEEEKVLAD